MKNIKLNLAKSLVLVALFCPAAFADGEQGSGGFAEGPTCSTNRDYSADGEQGSGGLTTTPCEGTTEVDSVFTSILDYLDSLI